MTSPTLLIPLDDSAQSARVLPFVRYLAERSTIRLVLAHYLIDPELRLRAETMLQEVAEQIHAPVDVLIEQRPAGQGIVETASRIGADLIAMATDRWSNLDRVLNDSVEDWVLRHTTTPLLVIPPEARPPSPSPSTSVAQRILVPLDGSAFAEEILPHAIRLAELLRAHLLLVHVSHGGAPEIEVDDAYLDEAAGEPISHGIITHTRVLVGDTAAALAHAADGPNVVAIAMATHGRTGLSRLLLGSVATSTLQHASVPMLLMRPAALREDASTEKERTPFMIVG